MSKEVRVLLGSLHDYTSLDDIKDVILDAEKQAVEQGVTRAYIEFYEDEGFTRAMLYGYRPETEQEQQTRLTNEKKSRELQEERLKRDAERAGYILVRKDVDTIS